MEGREKEKGTNMRREEKGSLVPRLICSGYEARRKVTCKAVDNFKTMKEERRRRGEE